MFRELIWHLLLKITDSVRPIVDRVGSNILLSKSGLFLEFSLSENTSFASQFLFLNYCLYVIDALCTPLFDDTYHFECAERVGLQIFIKFLQNLSIRVSENKLLRFRLELIEKAWLALHHQHRVQWDGTPARCCNFVCKRLERCEVVVKGFILRIKGSDDRHVLIDASSPCFLFLTILCSRSRGSSVMIINWRL